MRTIEDIERDIDAPVCAPTEETSEGFRLLAPHRQGARGDPSFNACRETCRELAYHHNLALFIGGKLENAKMGEFCCAAKPLRLNSEVH